MPMTMWPVLEGGRWCVTVMWRRLELVRYVVPTNASLALTFSKHLLVIVTIHLQLRVTAIVTITVSEQTTAESWRVLLLVPVLERH
jgi:hypothetical protein